jgi:hypothetical protein
MQQVTTLKLLYYALAHFLEGALFLADAAAIILDITHGRLG